MEKLKEELGNFKKEFIIEVEIFGQKRRASILAKTESEAIEKMFEGIKRQAKIKVDCPNNEWNMLSEQMDEMKRAFDFLDQMKKAKNN